MKRTALRITPLLGSIALLTPAHAVDIFRSTNNATLLNTAAAWQGGIVPGAGDVIVFDSTGVPAAATATSVTATNSMGAALSVLGIRVANNVGGTINTTNYLAIHNNGSATPFTLSLGSAGVDMSAANHALRIQAAIALTADQNWAVANANTANNVMGFNNGEDLSFDATSAGQAFNLGGFTVNTSGAGTINITSGYTLSNGTINIGSGVFLVQGGGSRVTTINNNVTLNVAVGSVLHFQSNSGASGASMASNATINLNGGTLRLAGNNATLTNTLGGIINVNSASTLNIGKPLTNDGAANAPINITGSLSGSGALSFTNTVVNAPVVTLSGNNSGYSGTVTFSGTAGRVTRMATATSGSAAATWDIASGHTLSLNAVAVDFGTLTGAGGISTYTAGTSTANVGAGNFSGVLSNGTGTLGLNKVGAGTLTLSGANTYTGATTVNAGTLLTTPAHTGATAITVADGATFGANLLAAGTTFNTPSLTVGTVTGGTVEVGNGGFGNPTAPIINATTFNPVTGTVVRVTGSGFTAATNIPLIQYGALGGGGFAGLLLSLPFRVSGNLVDDALNSQIDLDVTGVAVPVWRGTVNNNWDVDSVGDGSTGTQNWFATSGPNTYVQNAPVGTDSVLFDDTVGAGPTNVNLTTTLTPAGIAVNNSAVNYRFTGAGKLSGATGITKTGTGTLFLENTTANDNVGTTTISGGILQIGDGVTAGAGSLGGGPIVNNASLYLNRPDSFSIAGATSGTGSIAKFGAGTTTFTGANTVSGSVSLTAGTLRFTGGGNLSGPIDGTGLLESAGGTLQLSGALANTNTGLTTVSAGLLQLNKTSGTNAVGGDILIAGNGQLGLLASEVIPDTSSITLTGTSIDSIPTQTGQETFLNATVNSTTGGAAGGQIIMRNNMTILGTATVQSGILGVASSHTATINAVNITSAPGSNGILRIAGNSGPSVLHIGAGGITASGGEIQVKFNTNNQDAIVNLGGDFTATGNVAITNANYTGANLNIINLTGTRTFNIGTGTTTTVAPDLGGVGSLIKTGGGTLQLNASVLTSYPGDTIVNDGTLDLRGTIAGSNVIVNAARLTGDGTINTGPLGLELNTGAILAPGITTGTLTVGLAGASLDLTGAITPAASAALHFDLDTVAASDRLLTTGGALDIGSGLLEFDDFVFTLLGGFAPTPAGQDYILFDGDTPIVGFLGTNVSGIVGIAIGTLQFADGGNDLVLHVPEPGSAILLLGGLAHLATRRRRHRAG